MKREILMLLALVLLLGGMGQAAGGVIALHSGATDPTTEAFAGTTLVNPPSTEGPLTNDLGLPAWQITGSGQSSQFDYSAPTFTSSQLTDIANKGFTLTLVARVLQNGLASPYTSGDPVIIGGADVNFGGLRWEIDLGLDSSGDTVVVLPNSVDAAGPGNSVQSFGSDFTLIGSGSTYHTYSLFYNPSTGEGTLTVDGTVEITGYTGETDFVGSSALVWGAFSGGEGSFNLVELQSGSNPAPEPSALTLLGLGVASLMGHAWRRHFRVQ
jgi:hypothetical protein